MSELREIRDILFDLKEDMGEVRADVATIKSRGTTLEERLRSLELAQSHSTGRSSILGTIAGIIGGSAATWIARHLG